MIWQVDQAIRRIAQTDLRRQNIPEARDFSVCGLFCGQRQMAKFNMPEIVVNCKRKDHFSKEKRSFCGAATQIRTGDLILTKRLWNFFLTIFVLYSDIHSDLLAFRHFLSILFPYTPHRAVAENVVKSASPLLPAARPPTKWGGIFCPSAL